MNRTLSNRHVSLGWTAKSESRKSKWRKIEEIAVYDAIGLASERVVGIAIMNKEGSACVAYLRPSASAELTKGLLMYLVETSSITLAADDELQQILKQVQAVIKRDEEEAKQIVADVQNAFK